MSSEVSGKRRFAAAYLRCMDAEQAAREFGGGDGIRLLSSLGVQKELELQRSLCEVKRQDVLRRLAQLAFGRANDCVRLVLESAPEVETLDLSLLSEVKRNEKGTVEIKLVDRIRALERLLESSGGDTDCIDAFFAAANEDGESL